MTGAVRMQGLVSSRSPAELPREVIERAAARDPAACRALIRRYQRPVGRLLWRLLAPSGLEHLTEDLAQETMVRVFGALPRFDIDGPATVSTWILKIATRLGINELQRRRPKVEPLSAKAERLSGGPTADHEVRRKAIAAAINDAVAELPPDFRAAFLLREYHDLDYAEIAQVLELSPGTVKSRLSRARASLRTSLAQLHAQHQESDHG
ncbi:MAG: sigma-70 family RNA polymerase sigma factor [Myxococcota bacterium]